MPIRTFLLAGAALLALSSCGVAPSTSTVPSPSTSPSGSAIAAPAAPPCVIGADTLARAGDLDGALVALAACDAQDLVARAKRADVLVELGELPAAKALASSILTDARAGYAPDGSDVVDRAIAILALPDVVTAPSDEAIASAKRALDASRRVAPVDRARAKALARHALARAYGKPGVPTLVSRSASGRWAGNHPVWDVIVRPLASGGTTEAGLVIGDLQGSSIEFSRFVRTADASALAIPIPGDPGNFAVNTPTGVRVFLTGKPSVDLDASGTPVVSPNGREMAIIDKSLVTFVDVATWSTRATVPINGHSMGQFTDDGAYLLLLNGEPNAAVIDVARATVVVDEPSVRSDYSAPNRAVVMLRNDVAPPTLAIFALDTPAKPRRVTLAKDFDGWPGVEMDEKRILVIDYVSVGHMASDRRLLSALSFGGAKVGITQADRDAASATSGEALLKSLEGALPKGVTFQGSSVGNVGHAGPAPNGILAASTSRCVDRPCSAVEAGLVVLDVNKKTLLQTVPLSVKDGFTAEVVSLVDDGRFALACGGGSFGMGVFVVDVTTGRSTLLSNISDCWSLISSGARLWTSEGVRDLGADQSSDQWPPLARAEFVQFDSLVSDATVVMSPDGPGRYCRFGEALEPLDACVLNF